MDIREMGIDGLLCVMGETVCEEVNAAVYALKDRVEAAGLPGLRECVPGFASLLIRFDPMIWSAKKLEKRIQGLASAGEAVAAAESPIVEIPVCYGGEYGPDLEEVMRHTGLSAEEVIRLHSAPVYRIYMLGFLPGFPYLGGLDERLYTPRRESPRTAIPAGSVGIGGQQTGIYPLASPGGWQLIGRTPVRLFDPGSPLPFRAGDRIRFVPIGEQEFVSLENANGRKRRGD